jgi:hypothetical protein
MREHLIRRSDVVHADFADKADRFESPVTFVIRGRTGAELRINATVFSRDAVAALVDLRPDDLAARRSRSPQNP